MSAGQVRNASAPNRTVRSKSLALQFLLTANKASGEKVPASVNHGEVPIRLDPVQVAAIDSTELGPISIVNPAP